MATLHQIFGYNFESLLEPGRDGCQAENNLHTGIKT
jgi:hypothetical protein